MSDVLASTAASLVAAPTGAEEIRLFLEGSNSLKYVVSAEAAYNKSQVELVIHDPEKPRERRWMNYRPFVYIKDLKQAKVPFYGGNAQRRSEAMHKHRISIQPLRVTDNNGGVVERLNNGYKYIVFSDAGTGYHGLMNFFKEGGISPWGNKAQTARFILARPEGGAENPDTLYTGLAGEAGCELLYNHQTERYEVHIEAKYVNTRSAMDEVGDADFFIRLKAEGKELLKLDQDFRFHYDQDQEKYILELLPEADKPRKTRKLKDGSTYELPTIQEQEQALLEEVTDTSRMDHALVVAGMPADAKQLAQWDADAYVETLRTEGRWSKVQDRERKTALTEKRRVERQNASIEKKLVVLREKLVRAPSRKANVLDPRYTVSKLTVEYSVGYSDFFYTLKPVEQFFIQTGIRLFKGYERYRDVHKMDFDLETTGLFPGKHRIFLAGLLDNRGYQNIIAPSQLEDNQAEAELIQNFYSEVGRLAPAIIKGYNSENFDWEFLAQRSQLLGIESSIPALYGHTQEIQRKPGATLKLGGEAEVYTQTLIRGMNIIDVYHAVRRVQAVKSDMERATLKYVCQFEGIAKPNRVYIEGKHIYKIWEANEFYVAHVETNEYSRVPDEWQAVVSAQQQLAGYPVGFEGGRNEAGTLVVVPEELQSYGAKSYLTTGRALVFQYLVDDLWETNQVDERYNEDRYMMSKMMPTTFTRTCTMGGSSSWNLLMTAWYYHRGVAIPYRVPKYKFTGGLSRTFRLGKFKRVEKVDFSGLYPSIKLQYKLCPAHDVDGVLLRFLEYFKTARDGFKKIAGDESQPEAERKLAEARSQPLKVFNNSEFGSGGSGFSNWSFMEGAWETTCRGRQFLRGMVHFFIQYSCVPTVCDTDGVNFEVPDMVTVGLDLQPLAEPMSIEDYRYTNKGGKEFKGFACIVAKYNDEVLGDRPYMKLDLEAYWPSAINISRKNYANLEVGKDPSKPPKIKFVGNTIKDKNMPAYVREFVQKGLRMLLNDQGEEFVEFYYQHLTKIYTMQIPLRQIANKARVKQTLQDYQNRGTNKNGQAKGRQAHMELMIQNGIKADLGDTLYFVSTGNKKTHTYSTIDKATGRLMATLYTEREFEDNPDLTGEYNVVRYVDVFNSKVKALLVCFKPEVRDTLIKTNPTERNYYTPGDLTLISYDNPEPKDRLDSFFELESSEVRFWNRTGLDPGEVFEHYTVAEPYDGHFYARKLKSVQSLLAQHGKVVRCYRDRYENGHLVLQFDRKVYMYNALTAEGVLVPKELETYLLYPNREDGEPNLPFDNRTFQAVRYFRNLYGEHGRVIQNREYPLSEVVGGELVVLKTLYDAAPTAIEAGVPQLEAQQ